MTVQKRIYVSTSNMHSKREFVMKKTFLIVLVVMLLIFTFSLYATNPESFQVETTVGVRQGLKFVTPGTSTPDTVVTFDGLTADNDKFTVNNSNYNSAQTAKKLIAYCNSIAGYDISLAASAMTNANHSSLIKYTVTAGAASVTTNANGSETEATNKVVSKTTLSNIDFYGADIVIALDASDFLKATAGTYTGTIKITVTSHN